jgi:predicted permease
MQQAVTESFILALAGSGMGLLLTYVALPFLSRMVPLAMQAWTRPTLDWRLALFTCAIGIGSALFFGLLGFAPVRVNLQAALQQGGRGVSGTRHPLRRVLVMAQIALALPLLVGSGLMVQTVYKLSHVELGFNPENVLTLRTPLATTADSPYKDGAARHRFFEQVVQRVERLPGVVSAGFTSYIPLANRGGTSAFIVEGQPPLQPGEFNDANIRIATPDYLKTMQVQLVSGRLLDGRDVATAQNAVVVTQAVVEKYLRSNHPVGMRIRFMDDDPNAKPVWFTVVGVIADIRQAGLNLEPRPEMYFSEPQMSAIQDFENFYTPRDIAVRVQGDPASLAQSVRKAIWEVDPQQPISNVQPMQQWVDEELASRDMQLKLFASFAVVSVMLAAVGLYGLLAFTVSQRTRETGVRMALGAQTSDILRLYLSEGGRIILFGVGVGIVASFVTQRAMRALLFGVTDSGAVALCIGVAVIAMAGVAAVYIPARRAASVHPMEALRNE